MPGTESQVPFQVFGATMRDLQEDLRTILKNGPGKMRNEQRKPWIEPALQTKGSEDLRTGKDLR